MGSTEYPSNENNQKLKKSKQQSDPPAEKQALREVRTSGKGAACEGDNPEKQALRDEGHSEKQHSQSKWHPETRILHEGWHPETAGQPVTPSWEPSTAFRHSDQGLSSDNWSYTRLNNPNRSQLEKTLASLEGGADALVFASGMAAVQAVFHILSPGDHVLLPNDLYHGVRVLMADHYERWGLTCDFVDTASLESVKSAAQPHTRMLWLESPSNPMLKISDIASLSEYAAGMGWITVVDNTWSTPVIQRPLELGADIVLYSSTKYLGGHSDVLGGALVMRTENSGLRSLQVQAGAVPSPFDCWMMLRSMKSLFARVRTQSANARYLAGRLRDYPGIEKVYYPGLASHDGFETASHQMALPGAMISFEIKGDKAAALRVVSASRLIIPATSLGGVESTWEHRKSSEHESSSTPDNLIRLSTGIEHPEDIWNDIASSLEQIDT